MIDMHALKQIELFHNLDSIQLSHLASIMQEVPLAKNKMLFVEGDPAEHLYIIASGRIRISKIVPGIGEEAMAILEPGSYFGEMELVDPSIPRAAQALAHEHAQLWAIPYQDFRDLLASDQELAQAFLWNIAKTLVNRLRATNSKVTAMFALAAFS